MPHHLCSKSLSRLLFVPLVIFTLLGSSLAPAQAKSSFLTPSSPAYCSNITLPEVWLRLAFQAYDPATKNWDIFTANGCYMGNEAVRLTTSPAFDGYPRWNGDATRLVFVSERDGNDEIYTMLPDGSGVTRLTNNPAVDTTPTFSPDGSKIAFVSQRDGNAEIYAMNSDGSGLVRLTSNTFQDYDPDWSPDGKQIAWVQGNDTGRTVFVMNINGSLPHPISISMKNARRPVWSPNGQFLALDADDNLDGWQDLVEIRADGAGALVIPVDKLINSTYAEDFLMGGWSADGLNIYFSRAMYSKINNKWLMQKSELNITTLNGITSFLGETGRLISYPSSRGSDPYPPVATIQPMPEYSQPRAKLSWSIKDPGISGIKTYSIYYYIEPDGPWEIMSDFDTVVDKTNPSLWQGSTDAPYGVGHTFLYRIQAIDNAGNAMLVPAQAQTTYYDVKMDGRVTDNRGVPLAGAQVQTGENAVNSPLTDLQGKAPVYFADGSLLSPMAFSRPGYGSFPPQSWIPGAADPYLAVLPPVQNLVVNGDFENPNSVFSSWQISGSLPVLPGAGLSGNRSALLGRTCLSLLCLTPVETILETINPGVKGLVVDTDGISHLIASGCPQNTCETLYFTRSPGAAWSSPEVFPFMDSISKMQLSAGGTLYFTYEINGTNTMCLARKPRGGAWVFEPIPLPAPLNTIFSGVIDSQEQFHLLYAVYKPLDTVPVQYLRRLPNGSWVGPVNLDLTVPFLNRIILVAGPKGLPQVVYDTSSYNASLYSAQLASDGRLLAIQALPLWTYNLSYSKFVLDSFMISNNGELHVLSTDTYDGMAAYWKRGTDGAWTEPAVIQGESGQPYQMVVSSQGAVHIFSEGFRSLGGVNHFYKPAGQASFTRSTFDLGLISNWFLATLDDHDQVIFAISGGLFNGDIYANIYTTRLALADTSGEASISQSVTIPPGMHAPTLSFRYQVQQDFASPDSGSGIEVTITPNGGQPVLVFSSGEDRDVWMHGWADLSAWDGQTVTVAFRLRQAAGEEFARVAIDEVSIGSWNTPLIQSISPRVMTMNETKSTPLRLTGQNLDASAQVFIGTYASPDVTIDPANGDLLAALPPDILPGVYPVRVAYVDGREALAPNMLRLGNTSFIPRVIR